MFFIHEKHVEKNGIIRLTCEDDEVSLAGCNNGIIIKELAKCLRPEHNPRCGWEIPIGEIYAKENLSIIIDIKPNNSGELVLCEIDKVFGYSYEEWSPIMFRLNQLFNDINEESFNKYDFHYPDSVDIVYTMSYFSGSFVDGVLNGPWTWPGKSSTNSLMLFPEAITFFYERIKRYDPQFLKEKIKIIDF